MLLTFVLPLSPCVPSFQRALQRTRYRYILYHCICQVSRKPILCYVTGMKTSIHAKIHNVQVPVFVERDEDGFYVVECPLFSGCYTQGKTLDEALVNIREAIELVLEEEENQERLASYHPSEVSLHTITL